MRFVKNNFLLLAFCFLASVVAINSEKAIAGGDPSIKDKKVTNNKKCKKTSKQQIQVR